MKPIEIYCSEAPLLRGGTRPEYRWRIKSRNGKIIAASSYGFSSRAKCLDNIWRIAMVFGSVSARLTDGVDTDQIIGDLTSAGAK